MKQKIWEMLQVTGDQVQSLEDQYYGHVDAASDMVVLGLLAHYADLVPVFYVDMVMEQL